MINTLKYVCRKSRSKRIVMLLQSHLHLRSNLIVFDLDYTLWPLHVDECTSPFALDSSESIIDANGRQCRLFTETLNILEHIKSQNHIMAVASRPKNICGSYQLLHLFGIADYFRYKEIYRGTKKQHFCSLFAKTGIGFENMIFFDNDKRNVRDVRKLGVSSYHVTEEITLTFVNSCLNSWRMSNT